MKTVKPDYYDRFRCIAGACPFTCCKDWKIGVDRETAEVWKNVPLPEEMQKGGVLKDLTEEKQGETVIRLREDGRCPYLREDLLCSIVASYGEEALCHTCRTFPREIHRYSDRTEYTAAPGCPEILKLLWEQEEFRLTEAETGPGQTGGKKRNVTAAEGAGNAAETETLAASDPALIKFRELLLNRVSDPSVPASETLLTALLFLNRLSENAAVVSGAEIDEFFQKSVSQKLCGEIAEYAPDPYESFRERNELFLDLSAEYREKGTYGDILLPMSDSAEKLEDGRRKRKVLRAAEAFDEAAAPFDRKIRALLAERIYAGLYTPGGSLYTVLLKLEWITIFYAVLRQSLFLRWYDRGILSEKDLFQVVPVLVRMTDYADADIEEYLFASFDGELPDWGYFRLLL